jgi:hypothetical protein
LVRGRYKNQVKDSKSYPGANINSDHNLVLMHCELMFKKLQNKKVMKRFQLTNLKVEEIKNAYKENTRSMTHKSTSSVEEKWGNINQSLNC